MSTTLTLGTMPYRQANDEIHALLDNGETDIELREVFGQRYLGDALPDGCRLTIYGTPGNDMSAYMDGAEIEVFGNGQDQIGNTMNAGRIIVHGHCGDAAGYAMRGGEIFIRDYVGWRVGIHMKQYRSKCPVLVIGGDAGSFLGEYMAGGIIILLGKPDRYIGTGMHGGVIYLHGGIPADQVGSGIIQEPCDSNDLDVLENYLTRYNTYFGKDVPVRDNTFTKLIPASSRPYVNMYGRD